MRVELGGDVVAQPLRVHAQRQVLERVQAGATALAHLLAVVDGHEAVHEDVGRRPAAAEVQRRGPEQRVEVGDVLADEVVLLDVGRGHELGEAAGVAVLRGRAALVEPVLQRGQIADRRIQPDIEELARRVRDLDAEVGCVAADVPVAQAALTLFILGEPFLDLVEHLGLELARLGGPVLQELDAARVRQPEEVVVAGPEHRRGARQRRVRGLQLGGCVDRAARLAGVAVLVLRAALRALALDEAVGQEHALLGVEELLDRADLDQAVVAQAAVDVLREFVVFDAVGRVPVVERDVEAVEVFLAAGGNVGHELLRRLPGLLGGDHDRRTVRIVGADEVHLVAPHALEPHPDVGLDVLHDVADVELAVGVGQGGGDEELAGHGGVRGRSWRRLRRWRVGKPSILGRRP